LPDWRIAYLIVCLATDPFYPHHAPVIQTVKRRKFNGTVRERDFACTVNSAWARQRVFDVWWFCSERIVPLTSGVLCW